MVDWTLKPVSFVPTVGYKISAPQHPHPRRVPHFIFALHGEGGGEGGIMFCTHALDAPARKCAGGRGLTEFEQALNRGFINMGYMHGLLHIVSRVYRLSLIHI